MKKIAVIGSGKVGEVLANGFLRHGYAVMRASREPQKLDAWKQSAKGEASVGTTVDAAKWGEIIVVAVKGSAAEATIEMIAPHIAGKTVIDTTNPIVAAPPQHGVIQYFTNQNESLMERLQNKVPAAHFVKAFNSIGNELMVNPKLAEQPTMFICGNDPGAKREVAEILTTFGWETLDVGYVEAARPIESLCMLWCVPVILGSARNFGFKIVRAG
jgi:predicted dinucleotide-binding enzyme